MAIASISIHAITLENNYYFENQYTQLSTGILNVGYKRCSSTTICATLLLETMTDYGENKSAVGQI